MPSSRHPLRRGAGGRDAASRSDCGSTVTEGSVAGAVPGGECPRSGRGLRVHIVQGLGDPLHILPVEHPLRPRRSLARGRRWARPAAFVTFGRRGRRGRRRHEGLEGTVSLAPDGGPPGPGAAIDAASPTLQLAAAPKGRGAGFAAGGRQLAPAAAAALTGTCGGPAAAMAGPPQMLWQAPTVEKGKGKPAVYAATGQPPGYAAAR